MPALKAALARRPSAELRTALDDAIRLIQERGRGARGGLAVVQRLAPEAPGGRVSMVDPHRGQVGLPD